MIFSLITLFTALALAVISGWFSIVGMMAIFGAAAWQIAIMAGAFELAKIVTASWLYRHWSDTVWSMKLYLTSAVIILMVISSIGIFGYLSKAHLDQARDPGQATIQIVQLEQRIAREQQRITDAETVIGQLDQAVQTLMDYDRIRGADGAIATRERQGPEREQLNAIIDQAYARIQEFRDQKFPLQIQTQEAELNAGPLRYVAELIWDDGDKDNLERAVRLFVLLLVVVFDPLAIMLVLAANHSLMIRNKNKPVGPPEFPPVMSDPPPMPDVTEPKPEPEPEPEKPKKS
jgi:hypothetical protein